MINILPCIVNSHALRVFILLTTRAQINSLPTCKLKKKLSAETLVIEFNYTL